MNEVRLTQGIYLIELDNIKFIRDETIVKLRKIYPYAKIISFKRIKKTDKVKVIFAKNIHDIWEGL